MRRIVITGISTAALISGLVGCTAESTQDESAQDESTYAEAIYADYATASAPPGGQPAVQLDVRTASAGALHELAGRSIESIVGLPEYRIAASDSALHISDVRFVALDMARVNAHELAMTVDGFDDAGLPVGEGRYRALDVAVSIGGDTRTHQAVEFCWSSLDHCVVFDPAIEFLDSIVNGQRQRKAEGYGPIVKEERLPIHTGPSLATCGMASNPSTTNRSSTWGAYTVTYKNLYGIVMVYKSIGGQQSGLRCDSNCIPQPYGYSNVSSGYANFPYNFDCGNKAASGITGGTGKWEAETKCTHGLQFDVKADFTVSNLGSASVSINWDTVGSVDGNGGSLTDTCAWF